MIYCDYHQPGCKSTRAVGGHNCPNPCSTTNLPNFVMNCRGQLERCGHCNDYYCEYHFQANDRSDQAFGGHVCPNITQATALGSALAPIGSIIQTIPNKLFADRSLSQRLEVAKRLTATYGAEFNGNMVTRTGPHYPKLGAQVQVGKTVTKAIAQSDFEIDGIGCGVPGSGPAWVANAFKQVLGERLLPDQLQFVFAAAEAGRPVWVISTNWRFLRAELASSWLRTLQQIAKDPDYRDAVFAAINDQTGLHIGSYADEVDSMRSKNDWSGKAEKWDSWFMAFGVCKGVIAITQNGCASQNTLAEMVAAQTEQGTALRLFNAS